MGPPLCLLAAAIVSLLALPQREEPLDDYLARFQNAMEAFDGGEFAAAAYLFEMAGKLEESAPVWRVHAAVALKRVRRDEEAQAFAVEALRHGYPLSDLRAIDPSLVPGEPVTADLAPEDAATVLGLGVDAVLGRGEFVIGVDSVTVNGRLWSLVTGELEAAREAKRDRRVNDTRKTVRDQTANRYSTLAARRGLRTGLWIEGAPTRGEPRFLDGSRLALHRSTQRMDEPETAPTLILDVASLKAAIERLEPLGRNENDEDDETEARSFDALDRSNDGRWVAARSHDSLHLLAPDDLEPFVEIWTEDGGPDDFHVRASAVDGTFDLPAWQVEDAQVLLARRGFVPAARLAPWLWDPLHVRSIRDDDDRRPRVVRADLPRATAPRRIGYATDVALAETAPVVAVLGRAGAIQVRSAEDGKVLATSPRRFPSAWNLDLSPDGATIALLTRDREVYLWDWQGERAPERVTDVDERSRWTGWSFGCHVSFSPDGQRLLVCNDTSERFLLDREGLIVARIPRVDAQIEIEPSEDGWRTMHFSGFTEGAAWSPDGSRLALITEGRPAIHDAQTGGRLEIAFTGLEPTAECVAFGPRGRLIATGHFRGKVVLWDLETGIQVWIHEYTDPFFGKHDDQWNSLGVGDLAFSPSGDRIAMTSVTGIYGSLLDASTGERLWIGDFCGGRMGEPAKITWHDDGSAFYFAYVSGVMPVRRVALADDDGRPRPQQFDLEPGCPVDIGWDGRAAGTIEGAVVVRDAVSGRVLWKR
ncbi:MAG: WD40 repeat domain-containing protein [Planctomycetota bacterium]